MFVPEIAGACSGTCCRCAVCWRGLIDIILHDNGVKYRVLGLLEGPTAFKCDWGLKITTRCHDDDNRHGTSSRPYPSRRPQDSGIRIGVFTALKVTLPATNPAWIYMKPAMADVHDRINISLAFKQVISIPYALLPNYISSHTLLINLPISHHSPLPFAPLGSPCIENHLTRFAWGAPPNSILKPVRFSESD
jgi:hypothetical protein